MNAVGDIPEALLTHAVVGVNLSPGRLADHPDYKQICEIAASETSGGIA